MERPPRFVRNSLSRERIDITGQRFGYLTALYRIVGPLEGHSPLWWCVCDCGNEKAIPKRFLRSGHVIGCGCRVGGLRHGMSYTKTHRAWAAMIQRCTNPNVDSYCDYGGRGIKVCQRWLYFDNFLEDMGVAPTGLTLNRINNDKDYEPGNCNWVGWKAQQRNRRNNRLITYNGETKTLQAWSDQTGIQKDALKYRLNVGWSVESALFLPVITYRRHK